MYILILRAQKINDIKESERASEREKEQGEKIEPRKTGDMVVLVKWRHCVSIFLNSHFSIVHLVGGPMLMLLLLMLPWSKPFSTRFERSKNKVHKP